MKHTKRILAVLLAVAMVFSISAVVFAADDGSITIDNAVNGEQYNLYKVFDLTYSGEGQNNATGTTSTTAQAGTYEGVSYTYTASGSSDAFLTALQGTGSPFDVKAVAGSTTKYTVTKKSGVSDQAIIDFIEANFSKLPADRHVKTNTVAANNKVEWTGLAYGYYYVTSTTGSFVTIDSTIKDVTVKEKNTIPSQDKKQAVGTTAPTTAAGYTDDAQDVQIGDTVWYQIEVTDGKGTEAAIVITDAMSDGLTFDTTTNPTVVASINGAAEAAVAATNYEVSDKTAQGFKITLKADYVKTLTEADKVYIRFSAVVNTKAATDTDASKETNTSTLTYSNQTSTDTVEVKTYKFQLDKSDKDYKDLLGAKFQLYRSSIATSNLIKFTAGTAESGIPVLIVDPAGTIDTIDLTATGLNSAKVIIKGLDKDAYVLRETEAPSGYNPADDTSVPASTLVLIDGTITDAVETTTGDVGVVTVVNLTGAELPSTGGIGTTIFYIVGAVLVLGAGVVLVSRRRMRQN